MRTGQDGFRNIRGDIMNGKEEYNNKFNRMSLRRIDKSNPDWHLFGFYNSLIIKRSYKTAYEYLGYVIDFLEKYVEDVEQIDVDCYYGYMASMKNASSSKQIGAYHSLQKYSRYLKSKNLCEDYMTFIDRPKFFEDQKTIDKREKGFLTKSETKKMFDSIEKQYKNDIWKSRNYAILTIFLSTGIRCSALYKLDVDDVDLYNKTITVHEKGGKSRVINIPDQTVEAIENWLNYRKILLEDAAKENALIISSHRRRMESESIYCMIKRIGAIITGKNITPHKLRATYGTQLYTITKDLFFVQSCMGHSSPKTTEIYIRGQKSDISEKAANIMGKFID